MNKRKQSTCRRLRPLELLPLVLDNRHLFIAPPCSLCHKPIIDFDEAELFTRLEKRRIHKQWPRVGTMDDGTPIIKEPVPLYAGHIQCIRSATARGELFVATWKPLSSVLKMDQRSERDILLEKAGF